MATPFFFVHLMKTAGFSFAMQLHLQFPTDAVYPVESVDSVGVADFEAYVDVDRLVRLDETRRSTIQIYTGHFPFVACELMRMPLITITLLRDPVERTISMLKHLKRGLPVAPGAPVDTRVTRRYEELPLEAIYDDELVFNVFIDNHQTRVFALTPDDDIARAFPLAAALRFLRAGDAAREATRPDLAALVPLDAERLARAEANLASIDVLGLTDRYPVFVDELQQRFGWWADSVGVRARANVTPADEWNVPASFRRRIAADLSYDGELYEAARAIVSERAS